MGLQELGGQSDLQPPWQVLEAKLDGTWGFYTCNPPLAFRAVSLGLHPRHIPFVEKVSPLSCGVAVTLRKAGIRTFVVSAHLPHSHRADCLDTWHVFNSELDALLARKRIHDELVLLLDANYELGEVEFHIDPNNSDERSFLATGLMQQHSLIATRPDVYTWSNQRGAESKIDFVLVSSPSQELLSQQVHANTDFLLGCDHRAVSACFKSFGLPPSPSKRPKRQKNRCGQWRIDAPKLLQAAAALAEHHELRGQDFTIPDLQQLSDSVSFRPKSYRYVDPPHIRDLIAQRRRLVGPEARLLGKDILRARSAAKAAWLVDLLDKGAQGDFRAIAYFRRRQSVVTMHSNYIARAGGTSQAVQELKRFYKLKYTPETPPLVPAIDVFLARVPRFEKPALITLEEVNSVLSTCKAGKSCGEDGISYEFLQTLALTDLGVHLVDLFNSILFQTAEIPSTWLVSRLTFIPKVSCPSLPKHLRPIVLSSTPSKLFTKILLTRLRPFFPPPSANQIACIKGSQTLDGSTCLQHVIHLSQEYGLPLIAIKLDISSAFDHLSHDSVASYLALLGGKIESLLLLKIITLSRVVLGIGGESWQQKLFRGLLQGSSYSAEIFGRTLDHFLGFMCTRWDLSMDTWIKSTGPDGVTTKLFNLLYADDIILLATSYSQARRLLEDVVDILSSIGLSLALEKCKFLVSPDLPSRDLCVRNVTISPVRAFKFLGVLMGFDLNSQTVLASRLSMANNSFWGYYRILRRPCAPLRKRLHLLNTYVTSRWRWMSPCVRPVTAVRRALSSMHATFLTSLAGLAFDPFLTSSANWVSRRRASRMCAQILGHQSWAGAHAFSFMSYWGHAARIHLSRHAPLCVVLRIRDSHWLKDNWKKTRRQLGYWPNSYRYIQLQWEELRGLGTPPYWENAALDRVLWTYFVQTWLNHKGLQPLKYYPEINQVDLCGRCLLQTGETFCLLPFRHVPVEEPYEAPYRFVPSPVVHVAEACLQVCSDGSHKNKLGAFAVSFLAPYAPIQDAVVAQGKVEGDCTSTKAELRAAIQALRMIRAALPHIHDVPIVFMTDSSFVLQVLDEQCRFNCHPHDLHQLLNLWREVCPRTTKQHVRGHSGHPLNTLTDKFARAALSFHHTRVLYRKVDYSRVHMNLQHHGFPNFHEWL